MPTLEQILILEEAVEKAEAELRSALLELHKTIEDSKRAWERAQATAERIRDLKERIES